MGVAACLHVESIGQRRFVDELFDEKIHGHTAELIGDETLLAVHLKLAKKADS